MTYSLSNPPKWLSIDSDARRLFGTPGQDDAAPGHVTGVPLNLVATDDSGSTTLTATLVVSASSGPRVEIPLQNQVPDFGTFSSPSSILFAPGKGFSFKLDPNTFSKPAGPLINYYATMADNTPLPAWISFDPTSLSLSGQTPPAESLVQPPQHFPFRVIAADVVGFAGAAMDIDLVVGNHQLTADETTIVLNATRGAPLSYTGLRDTISLDGKKAVPGSVDLAPSSNIPAWLSVNKHTWQMTGAPPRFSRVNQLYCYTPRYLLQRLEPDGSDLRNRRQSRPFHRGHAQSHHYPWQAILLRPSTVSVEPSGHRGLV
jgi:axial budding pattern protein 2